MTLVEPDRPRVAPLFADDLSRHGTRMAVTTAAGSITYTDLDRRVGSIAARLGVDRRLVLVTVGNTLDALVTYLAALRGRHPILLAPADNPSMVQPLIDAYDPDVVVSAGGHWDFDERRTSTAHDLHPDLTLLMSTSGSTGSPKLVRLSRQNIHANAAAISHYLGITTADRAITTLPMHYCYGLSVINSHLHAGAGLVLTDLSVVDHCFWDLFDATSTTSFAGVPHTFDLLDRVGFESMSLPELRYVTQAGGRMHPDTVRRYAKLGARDGWDLFVMYGQTEATARMAYLPPAVAASRPEAIGMPIPGGSFTIDSPDINGIGELVYRGANVMLGYAERPADLALGATVDALRTGDLARMTDDVYEIVGRRSRFIKPYGLRIDLDRLERALVDGGIAGVCTGDDEQLIVGVERTDQVDTATRLVVGHLHLPRTRVRVVGVGELPRLANGKPDYAMVRKRAIDWQNGTADAGPSGWPPPVVEVSEQGADHWVSVRAAYMEILGVEPTEEDTFVGLGGDSLSYVEMSIVLEEILGVLPRDWHTTPIAGLTPVRRARRFTVATDTSTVVRAVAIVLIVGTHAGLWQLAGGAHTLIAVAGYNFARFQLRATTMLAGIARIAVPSMCWIAVVAATSDKYGWPNALLLSGFIERPGDHWGYWFIEALVQILVVLAFVLAIPAVSRLERRRPFALALGAIAAGLLVRFDVVELTSTHRISRPHELFWLFALGWAAARATSWRHRLVVSALAAVAVSGFFGDTQRELIVLAGVLIIIWAQTVLLPRLAQRLVAPVAGGSLYIYLTHYQVFPPLARLGSPVVAVAGSVLVGTLAWFVARRVIQLSRRPGVSGSLNAPIYESKLSSFSR